MSHNSLLVNIIDLRFSYFKIDAYRSTSVSNIAWLTLNECVSASILCNIWKQSSNQSSTYNVGFKIV